MRCSRSNAPWLRLTSHRQALRRTAWHVALLRVCAFVAKLLSMAHGSFASSNFSHYLAWMCPVTCCRGTEVPVAHMPQLTQLLLQAEDAALQQGMSAVCGDFGGQGAQEPLTAQAIEAEWEEFREQWECVVRRLHLSANQIVRTRDHSTSPRAAHFAKDPSTAWYT